MHVGSKLCSLLVLDAITRANVNGCFAIEIVLDCAFIFGVVFTQKSVNPLGKGGFGYNLGELYYRVYVVCAGAHCVLFLDAQKHLFVVFVGLQRNDQILDTFG